MSLPCACNISFNIKTIACPRNPSFGAYGSFKPIAQLNNNCA